MVNSRFLPVGFGVQNPREAVAHTTRVHMIVLVQQKFHVV